MNEKSANIKFVADGQQRAREATVEQVRAEVLKKYMGQLAKAG